MKNKNKSYELITHNLPMPIVNCQCGGSYTSPFESQHKESKRHIFFFLSPLEQKAEVERIEKERQTKKEEETKMELWKQEKIQKEMKLQEEWKQNPKKGFVNCDFCNDILGNLLGTPIRSHCKSCDGYV